MKDYKTKLYLVSLICRCTHEDAYQATCNKCSVSGFPTEPNSHRLVGEKYIYF